jgi:hypothetical protein
MSWQFLMSGLADWYRAANFQPMGSSCFYPGIDW